MKNFLRGAAAAAWLLIAPAAPALAQSSPGWSKGKVPTAGEWNAAFAAKQDALGYVPLSTAGGTMSGRLITAPPGPTTSALNLTPGNTPASPVNGDLWVTSDGLFARINGVTIGPLSGPSGASFNAIAPLNLTFPNSVVTYGLNIDSTLGISGGNLGIALNHQNAWSVLQTFSAGVSIASTFSAPGLVKNSDLVNSSTTVNGQTCALGGNCTITASAGTITVGNTTVALGTNGRVLFDNAGVLGEYPITGSGNVVLSISPTLTGTITGAAANFSGAVSIGGAVTIANVLQAFPASGNIVGTTDAQTLTNKSLSGSSNTFTNIPNSALVNPQVTVNGTTCVLGTTCTPNAGPIVVGTTLITSGVNTRVLFDNAGQVGEYSISGTGNVAMTNSPTFVTPTLGAAIGTSLALNGCTISGLALCAGGASSFGGPVAISSVSPAALAVGPNGGTNPVLQVNGSVSLSATGITLNGAAAGNGAGLGVLSPNPSESLVINAKGSSAITIGANSTGAVQIGQGGGGLTVFNSFTATGLVTFADMAAAAIANASQYFSGATNVLVPASVVYQAETVTTFAAAIVFDFNTFINTAVTLTGNITTMTLNNVKAGQAGTIAFIQDSTGGRTAVFNSILKFAGGTTPTLSSAPSSVDVLAYSCRSATFCVASLVPNVK
jgi:hypothetical protein